MHPKAAAGTQERRGELVRHRARKQRTSRGGDPQPSLLHADLGPRQLQAKPRSCRCRGGGQRTGAAVYITWPAPPPASSAPNGRPERGPGAREARHPAPGDAEPRLAAQGPGKTAPVRPALWLRARPTYLVSGTRARGAAAQPEAEAEAERGAQQHGGAQQRGHRLHRVPAQQQPRVAPAVRPAAGHRGRSGRGPAASRRPVHRHRHVGDPGLGARSQAGQGRCALSRLSGLCGLLPGSFPSRRCLSRREEPGSSARNFGPPRPSPACALSMPGGAAFQPEDFGESSRLTLGLRTSAERGAHQRRRVLLGVHWALTIAKRSV